MARGTRPGRVTALAVAGLLCAPFGCADAAPPLEAYGHLPELEAVRISPSGERIATAAVVNEQRRLVVSTVGGTIVQAVSLGQEKVSGIDWVGEDHVLVTMHSTFKSPFFVQNHEMFTVASLRVSTGKIADVFKQAPWVANVVRRIPEYVEVDGHPYGYFGGITLVETAAQKYVFTHSYPDLYQVALDSGATKLVARGRDAYEDWAIGSNGDVVAHSEYDPQKGRWQLYAGKDHDKLLMETTSTVDSPDLEGQGRTDGTVLVSDPTGPEDAMVEIAVADGRREELIRGDADVDVVRDRDTGHLLGFVAEKESETRLFDGGLRKHVAALRKAFAGYRFRLVSMSRKMDRLIVRTDGADDSGTYWLVDVPSGKADPLGQSRPAIHAADVGPTRWFQYKAADGLALQGVLTLPPGRKNVALPVVVMPHGGPLGVADDIGFDWWAQAYASVGYAVFQPNYRGSGGYGRAFRDAGLGEWGRKMVTDMSDGLAALAAQGIVDPRRACIVGASYGGYAALAGVTLQHGLYRCAVSVAGPADLTALFQWRIQRYGYESGATRYWRKATGADKEGDEAMGRLSPARFAQKADAPILLVHGVDDTVVPIAQSEAMAAALTLAEKPFEFTRMKGEDHWLSRDATRVAMLKASVEFVKRHNPPD
jgi:dipeptidyl aminopeptidase/acylaminoacyl peptidase